LDFYDQVEKLLKRMRRTFTIKEKRLTLNNISLAILTIIFLFLISGGLVTTFAPGTSAYGLTTQSILEFSLYFIMNGLYLVGIILIYRGLSKGVVDIGILVIGVILLFLVLLSEIYILLVLKGSI